MRYALRLGVFLLATPCFGAVSHVQQASNSDVTAKTYTSFSAEFSTPTTSGNAILVGVTYGNVNPAITVTDSQGNTYVQAINIYDSSHRQGSAIFYALNITGGASNQITVKFNSSVAYLAVGIHEYTGFATSSALDVTSAIRGSGNSVSSGPATTTAGGDLVFGCGVEDVQGSGDTFTAGSGFTKRADLGIAAGYADEDQVQGAAGSIAATWTLSPSRNWIAAMAAFKAASGAGGSMAPTIASLSPTSGPVGALVTITGTNFGGTQGTSTVTFNGTPATPTSWSSTSIVAPVPAGATTGNVVVTVAGVASNGVSFTVVAPPSITSINPASGPVGAAVTITGANFGATQGTSTVPFGGATATPTSWSATNIVVPVPSLASTGGVLVIVGGYASNVVTFTVTSPPTITSLSPTSGSISTPVTITGANFGFTQPPTVTFNGTPSTPTSWGSGNIVAPVPSGATTGNVVVTASGGASNGVSFTVTIIAVSITPSTANPWTGTSTGFMATVQNDVQGKGVAFSLSGAGCAGSACGTLSGGTSTTTVSYNAPLIAPTPPAVTLTATSVADPTKSAAATINMTQAPTPTITSLNPTSGPVRTVVTIAGTNFGGTQGASAVTFNGTVASPTSWSDTSIATQVPDGGTTGNVVVTTSGGASNALSFTVVPSIISLSPTSGAAGTSIIITGGGFGATQGTSTVTFNGTPATPASWSDTSIVAPVPGGATTGNVVVTVAGVNSNGVSFNVLAPPGAGVSHVQQASNSDVSGAAHTSLTATFSAATTTGNAIIVGVTFGNINPTITAADSQGNAYAQAVKTYDAGHNQGCAILYAVNITEGASNQVTVNFSGSVAYLGLGIHEYSGVVASSALDRTAGATGSGSNPSSGSATTTANGDLIFGCGVEDSAGSGDTFTAGNSFTKRVDLGSAAGYADEDEIQGTAGSVAVTWTLSPSGRGWIANMAAFKASSVGSTGPSITSLSPTSGGAGTSVTIGGTNFGGTQGTSTVTFNGTPATPTSWGGTTILALVPSGATTGNVVVTVAGVNSNGITFFVPGSAGWTEIPNTTITPNCPVDTTGTITENVGCPAVTTSWSGGIADTTNNRMIVWGGGHLNYAGNELYSLNLSANPINMTRLTISPPTPTQPFNGGCTDGQSDGNPTSRETYGGLAFMPNVGLSGKMYAYSGALASCGTAGNDTWTFDLNAMTWQRQDPTNGGPPQGCYGCIADYDPNTGLVFNMVAAGTDLLQLWTYDPVTNTYSCKSTVTGCDAANGYTWNNDKSGAIDYGRKMFFALGGALVDGHPAFIKVDISGNDPNYSFTDISANHTQKTDGCYPLITAYAPGLAYDPVNKNLVGWFGGNSVVVYNPDTDSCTTLTYSGGPPSPPRPDPFGGTYPAGSQQLNGTYGRFRYFPTLGMFVVINDNDLDAWLLKL